MNRRDRKRLTFFAALAAAFFFVKRKAITMVSESSDPADSGPMATNTPRSSPEWKGTPPEKVPGTFASTQGTGPSGTGDIMGFIDDAARGAIATAAGIQIVRPLAVTRLDYSTLRVDNSAGSHGTVSNAKVRKILEDHNLIEKV